MYVHRTCRNTKHNRNTMGKKVHKQWVENEEIQLQNINFECYVPLLIHISRHRARSSLIVIVAIQLKKKNEERREIGRQGRNGTHSNRGREVLFRVIRTKPFKRMSLILMLDACPIAACRLASTPLPNHVPSAPLLLFKYGCEWRCCALSVHQWPRWNHKRSPKESQRAQIVFTSQPSARSHKQCDKNKYKSHLSTMQSLTVTWKQTKIQEWYDDGNDADDDEESAVFTIWWWENMRTEKPRHTHTHTNAKGKIIVHVEMAKKHDICAAIALQQRDKYMPKKWKT